MKSSHPFLTIDATAISFPSPPLKYAENNYYSLKDKKKLLNNIKFSYDELDTLLKKD